MVPSSAWSASQAPEPQRHEHRTVYLLAGEQFKAPRTVRAEANSMLGATPECRVCSR